LVALGEKREEGAFDGMREKERLEAVFDLARVCVTFRVRESALRRVWASV
jgi:hypothetical protein